MTAALEPVIGMIAHVQGDGEDLYAVVVAIQYFEEGDIERVLVSPFEGAALMFWRDSRDGRFQARGRADQTRPYCVFVSPEDARLHLPAAERERIDEKLDNWSINAAAIGVYPDRMQTQMELDWEEIHDPTYGWVTA